MANIPKQDSNSRLPMEKHWKGSKFCKLCNAEETIDHLFFQCLLSISMWNVIKDGLN
jgi:hypothetical protein